ncbi:MAG: hypothetical protein ACTSPM_10805, partial [Candidatus Heimdallarchaeota archaeon]
MRAEPTSIVPTIQGATPLTQDNRAPVFKRILSAVFDYGMTLFLIAVGGFLAGTARTPIEIIAGSVVAFLGLFTFFAAHVLILLNKKMFSGISTGKGFAKLRVVKIVDSKNKIIQPMPKNKKGIMIGRAFLAF